jgi:hypothetical protein
MRWPWPTGAVAPLEKTNYVNVLLINSPEERNLQLVFFQMAKILVL